MNEMFVRSRKGLLGCIKMIHHFHVTEYGTCDKVLFSCIVHN